MTQKLILAGLIGLSTLSAFGLGSAGGKTVLTCQTSRTFQQLHLDVKKLTGLTGGRPGSLIATLSQDGRLKAVSPVTAFNNTQFHGYESRNKDLAIRISHIQPMDLAVPFVRGTLEYTEAGRLVSAQVRCNTNPGLSEN